MSSSERRTKPTLRERFRDWRQRRRRRRVDRAMTRPDVENSAEAALYRQGGERGRASDRQF